MKNPLIGRVGLPAPVALASLAFALPAPALVLEASRHQCAPTTGPAFAASASQT
jgi:hypothetical protein